MTTARCGSLLAIGIVALGLAACGGVTDMTASAAHGQRGRSSASSRAATTALQAATTATLLTIPGFGRLSAACDRGGRPAVTFRATRGQTIIAAVGDGATPPAVRRLDPGGTLRASSAGTAGTLQTWQLATFQADAARVATATVTTRSSPTAPPCFFAARVEVTVSPR